MTWPPYTDKLPSTNSSFAKQGPSRILIPVQLNRWYHFDAIFKCSSRVRSSPGRIGTTNIRKVAEWWYWHTEPSFPCMLQRIRPIARLGSPPETCRRIVVQTFIDLGWKSDKRTLDIVIEIPTYQIFQATFAVDTIIRRYCYCCYFVFCV